MTDCARQQTLVSRCYPALRTSISALIASVRLALVITPADGDCNW
jgi:hypothetical protein